MCVLTRDARLCCVHGRENAGVCGRVVFLAVVCGRVGGVGCRCYPCLLMMDRWVLLLVVVEMRAESTLGYALLPKAPPLGYGVLPFQGGCTMWETAYPQGVASLCRWATECRAFSPFLSMTCVVDGCVWVLLLVVVRFRCYPRVLMMDRWVLLVVLGRVVLLVVRGLVGGMCCRCCTRVLLMGMCGGVIVGGCACAGWWRAEMRAESPAASIAQWQRLGYMAPECMSP